MESPNDARDPLSALADKYKRLLRLRETQGRSIEAPHAELRALARQFPGALRELDQLPLSVLTSRLEAIELTLARGTEPALWMRLQIGYHGLMRAALRVKRWSRDWPPEVELALARLAERYHPAPDEPALTFFAAETYVQIRSPPGGRLNPIVLAAVAKLHGVPANEVQSALFLR